MGETTKQEQKKTVTTWKPRKEKIVPMLRFTPTAWAKLQFFCHHKENEVGGFAVTREGDPLLVEDFVSLRQEVSLASISFDDEAVADFFEEQVDSGRRPEQFARIWLHTHPGSCATPSSVDEGTFERVFGCCDWAVMFVLARTGETHARLRFNIGPKAEMEIPVRIDYSLPFPASNDEAWKAEYERTIRHPHAGANALNSDDKKVMADMCWDVNWWKAAYPEMFLDDDEAVEFAEIEEDVPEGGGFE